MSVGMTDASLSRSQGLATKESDGAARRGLLLSRLIGALGFICVVWESTPGFMSPDSVVQLEQARSLAFSDDHPPLMALLWALPDRLVSGPFGMLLLLNAIYWGALVACFRRFPLPAPLRVVCLAITAFLPPLFVNLGVIWKDILMQGALLALLASCLAFQQTRRARALGWVAFWSAIAIGSRHNAAAAVWPLLALAAAAHPRLASLSRVRRAAAALASSLVIVVCIQQALTLGFRPFTKQTHFWQLTALFDLAGMSVVEEQVLFDRDMGALRDGAQLADIRRSFNPRDHMTLYGCARKGCRPLLTPVEEPAQQARLARNWQRAISEHPLGYLRHRAEVYRHLLGLDAQPVINFPIIVRNPWGYALQPNRFRDVVVSFIDSLLTTPLFSPWLYVLVCGAGVALGGVAAARGGSAVPLALCASGLLYHLTFFFLACSPPYRYSLWTMMCAVLASYALLGALVRAYGVLGVWARRMANQPSMSSAP